MPTRYPDDPLTQVLDVPTVPTPPPTMRRDGFRDTQPFPPLAQGEVTRWATGIGAGAVPFADVTSQLVRAVQAWVTSPHSGLQPHEVFLLGRRLERLRLASHAPLGRGGFADTSARQALEALPQGRTPPDVVAKARRLIEHMSHARLAQSQPASPARDTPSPVPAAEPVMRRRLPVVPVLLVVMLASVGVWVSQL